MKYHKMRITVLYGTNTDLSEQIKTVNDLDDALIWCKKHYRKIYMINKKKTFFELLPDAQLIKAIKEQ